MITDNKLKPKHRGAHSELTAAAWSLDHGYEVSRNVGKSLADAFIRADEASDWWDGYCERTDFDKSPASVEINGTKDFSIGVITSTGLVTEVMRWKPVMRKPLHGEYWLPKSESGFCLITSLRFCVETPQ